MDGTPVVHASLYSQLQEHPRTGLPGGKSTSSKQPVSLECLDLIIDIERWARVIVKNHLTNVPPGGQVKAAVDYINKLPDDVLPTMRQYGSRLVSSAYRVLGYSQPRITIKIACPDCPSDSGHATKTQWTLSIQRDFSGKVLCRKCGGEWDPEFFKEKTS